LNGRTVAPSLKQLKKLKQEDTAPKNHLQASQSLPPTTEAGLTPAHATPGKMAMRLAANALIRRVFVQVLPSAFIAFAIGPLRQRRSRSNNESGARIA
jgi:hypothetical protein